MNNRAGVVLNCRTCTRACKQYKSLLDEVDIGANELITVANMLSYCCDKSFAPQDGASTAMPQHICVNCLQLLEQAFQFKRMVLDSDELLRIGLNETNEEYLMIEMLNEEHDPNQQPSEEINNIIETEIISEHPEVDYIVEPVNETETELDPDSLEYEFQSADVEVVTIKDEYTSILNNENEEIEVMDTVIPNDQMFDEEIIVMQSEDSTVCDEMIDTDDISHEEHLLTVENDDLDQDDIFEESLDSVQLSGDISPHVCTVCGKAFRQQCRLNQHMRSHVEEKQYRCEKCNKKLKHLRNYKEHMLTHSNVKPHQCNICLRFYRTTSSLAAHKRTHAEDKPYKCDQCGRGYAAVDHLRRHKMTHTGERPYACDQCDKAYYDSSSLRQHKISHTGEKAFTCEICGVGLSQKSGYKKHMLVHSGEKPHKCNICGRAFTFTSNLNAHVRLHSGVKPFKCDKCMKAFPTKKRLTSHLRVHNKEAPVMPTTGVVSTRRSARPKDGTRSNLLPDLMDQQMSTSKVVMVL